MSPPRLPWIDNVCCTSPVLPPTSCPSPLNVVDNVIPGISTATLMRRAAGRQRVDDLLVEHPLPLDALNVDQAVSLQ